MECLDTKENVILPEGSTIYISHVSNRPVKDEKMLRSINGIHKRNHGRSGFMMSVKLYEYKLYTELTHRYTYRIKCITKSPIDIFAIIETDKELLIDIDDILDNVEVVDIFYRYRGY